ncbi:hypothetical protein [Vibrio diazotrophicus]|uniref:PH domain-containing protein n=1 Tax=Vibrio diazotrophicus TaxID=685 RepID=A0ABX4W3Z2_VIBDI|nr:hypothetical protein [Vibrio diazotrophicus]PNH96136.1 hypothetical protein C1O25_21920 [Vibrio diazotrophicus]
MVYHVSKKYLLKKGLEPFILTLFWLLLAYLTSLIISVDINEQLIITIKNSSVILFLTTLLITIVRIYFLTNTVLVIDKNGVVYRVREKALKFSWADLSRVRVYKSKRKIISLELFPHNKKLTVYFLDGLDDLVGDIERNRKNSNYILSEFIDVKT